MKNNFWFLCFMVFLAAITRLFPHPANFTVVGALALFGGTYFSNKTTALLMPLSAMLFSDIIMEILFRTGIGTTPGFHNTMIYVYFAFAASVGIGFWIKQEVSVFRIIAGTVVASLLFFVVTNFAVWLSGYYGLTTQGLVSCYIAAIPFYQNSVFGDLFFSAVLFGSFEWLKLNKPQLAFERA